MLVLTGTPLGANPRLCRSLEDSLRRSEFYILLASPGSALSPWVGQELSFWLGSRGCAQLLIVQTAGSIIWIPAAKDFDWSQTHALNGKVLSGKFAEAPLWVDASWARGLDESAVRRHERFADLVATLASPLHGRPKSDVFGEDLRQHREQMRLARAAVVSLVVLLAAALGCGTPPPTTPLSELAFRCRKATSRVWPSIRTERSSRRGTIAEHRAAWSSGRIAAACP